MTAHRPFSLLVTILALVARPIDSFVQFPRGSSLQHLKPSKLYIGDIFGGLFGQSQSTTNVAKPVIEMPATRVKVGPLKFFLQIYLVAEQNKPVKGSWALSNNEENGSLDMYYKDGTGMFSIGLEDNKIRIDRHGSRPSLQYMLQESVMLHGILDEINSIAFEVVDIEQEKRLIQFVDDDAIANARRALPARNEG
jgi:hypothetical protein